MRQALLARDVYVRVTGKLRLPMAPMATAFRVILDGLEIRPTDLTQSWRRRRLPARNTPGTCHRFEVAC